MTLQVKDRVLETTTTTGTSDITLAGAVAGFRQFSAVCSVADTFYYMIEAIDSSGTPTGDWETGLGTYSALNTLTRTTVTASSNSGSVVSFSIGTKRVGISVIASQIGYVPAVIRSSNIQSSSTSNFTVTFPAGAAVGDLVLIVGGAGFSFTLPAGWNYLDNIAGTNFNGIVTSRILNSNDITAGSVVLSATGTFNGVVVCICFTGAPTIKNLSTSRNGAGAATRTTTVSGLATDYAIYFGFNRNASADTNSLGSAVQSINAANASGVVTAGVIGATSVTNTVTYGTSSGTTGDYQGIVCLTG